MLAHTNDSLSLELWSLLNNNNNNNNNHINFTTRANKLTTCSLQYGATPPPRGGKFLLFTIPSSPTHTQPSRPFHEDTSSWRRQTTEDTNHHSQIEVGQ